MGFVESTIIGLITGWIAFVAGLIIGWTWKPRWASKKSNKVKLRCSAPRSHFDVSLPSPSPSPKSATSSPLKGFGSAPCLKALVSDTWTMALRQQQTTIDHVSSSDHSQPNDVTLRLKKREERLPSTVTELDLRNLVQLVERKDGGLAWTQMMDRSTPCMQYQAWLREPKSGPTEYRSRTVFEDSTPEILRDFFWDDEFRPTWDTMLANSTIIDECPTSGTMIVKWIRKFPLFCSDREYIIGRRIWKCGNSYYCVTKGVSVPSIPRNKKLKRVDLFYSSWCIRPVESRRGDGLTSASEVLLFHHEDMGIPRELAKFGIKQGMWGAVKKMEPGLRNYQRQRFSGTKLSRSAFIAKINTKITLEHLKSLVLGSLVAETPVTSNQRDYGKNLKKVLILGGAVAVVCSLSRGFVPPSFLFGFGRRKRQLEARTNGGEE